MLFRACCADTKGEEWEVRSETCLSQGQSLKPPADRLGESCFANEVSQMAWAKGGVKGRQKCVFCGPRHVDNA